MELNDFVKKFAAQFEETEPSAFAPETKFRELEEWSSLMGLSIIAMICEGYNVVLNGHDMRQANTIEELFNIAKSKE